ncbi:hypothetical protein R1sor_007222 [Riccia sorocarpa]|uniref:Uncharacterized protein n=1 Tax=Riccia sorocarpa TaxID=122646 RepID=A0ABD3HRK3_9MARC
MPRLSKKTSSKRSIEIIDSLVSHNTRFRMQQRETVEEFCKFIGSPGVVQKKDVGEVLKEGDGEDVEKTVPDGDDITTGGNGHEKCQVGDHIARSHEEFFQEDMDRISLGFEGRRAPQEGSSSAPRKGVKRRSLGSSFVTRLFEGEEGWDVEGRVRISQERTALLEFDAAKRGEAMAETADWSSGADEGETSGGRDVVGRSSGQEESPDSRHSHEREASTHTGGRNPEAASPRHGGMQRAGESSRSLGQGQSPSGSHSKSTGVLNSVSAQN